MHVCLVATCTGYQGVACGGDWPAIGECDGGTWVVQSGPKVAYVVDLLEVHVTTAQGGSLSGPK